MVSMEKRYVVNLTPAEREGLQQIVGRERVSGLKRTRANILLKADEGLTDQEIADELEVALDFLQVSDAQRGPIRDALKRMALHLYGAGSELDVLCSLAVTLFA